MKIKKYIPSLRFIIFSGIGVFVFFVRVNIGGNSSIFADHLISLLKNALKADYLYIIMALTAYSVIKRVTGMLKNKDRTATDIFFLTQAVLGLLLCMLKCFGVLPQNLAAMTESAVNATGNILCAIFITALFIPFLTEYGLVDFAGVLCRPFMRKLFLTPGSSAVIGVSAFLGNYSMGHIISRQMYEEGRFTEKECVIVATGFSTCSIGLMINLVNYMGLMQYWEAYVATVLLATFLTTMLTARIYPVCKKRNEYVKGAFPEPEPRHGAFRTGVLKASQAAPLWKNVINILRRMFPVLCEITGTSVFVIPLGMFLAKYTGIFGIIGSIFRPLLYLFGIGGSEAVQCAGALGISILEPVLAGVISEGALSSAAAKWIAAVVPYSAVIFFAGFVPSLWRCRIQCRMHELLIIWVERVAAGIMITGIIAKLLQFMGFFG